MCVIKYLNKKIKVASHLKVNLMNIKNSKSYCIYITKKAFFFNFHLKRIVIDCSFIFNTFIITSEFIKT